MTIAQTIFEQLGGKRFAMMTGSKQFVGGERSLSMKLSRNKCATHLTITLNGHDTYDLTFSRWNGRSLEMKTVETVDDVYADQLQDIFTAKTGLYTKF